MAKKANSSNHCSFCGRSENDVNLLISGISGYICDMCCEQAHEIVNETFK
ncbi:MAG TPA: ATP-dependent Clp protease ATP-binding subunit ClpX, partial [Porphyromonadaceae bacterium]|nr:ATP-dependent Clp protease ATP-binding subunit ClpX [Porphyromonadaceae bacterium]